jgi:pimeloyl-ACP methyl ester carboxylesterase
MGKSDKPSCRYSTSEMAKDVVDLLKHLKWLKGPDNDNLSAPVNLNVIGVSMGGMIAQELALLLPKGSISSLTLVSTASRIVRTVPFVENLRQRINMFVPRDIDVQLEEISHRLFADKFLAAPDTEADEQYTGGPEGGNFPTNRDRYCAGEIDKRLDKEGFTRKGFMLQAIAAGWHHKSAEQTKEIGDRVGRDRIAVIHATADRMITFKHGEILRDELGEGIEWKVWDGGGHVLMWEEEKEYNAFMEKMIERGEKAGS